jgi:hypothetical protein
MGARTTANTIRSPRPDALKLRLVNHKYAAQITAHARAVERHARKLVGLRAKIKAEAIAMAGPD